MTKKVKVEWKQEVVTEIVRVKQIVMERPIQYQDNIASTQEAGRFGVSEIGDEAQKVVLVIILNTKISKWGEVDNTTGWRISSFSGQFRDRSHSCSITHIIPGYRELLKHHKVQTGTQAAFQEKNAGRSPLIDR